MRRLLWIPLALLVSTTAYGQSAQRPADASSPPEACKDVEAYKDKAPEDDSGYLQIWWNTWTCETWANEHGSQKLAHDSFNTLDHLYTHESSALETQLWSSKDAPAVCKVFQDDQKVLHDAIMAGITGKLSKAETLERADRAREDFRARFKQSITENRKAVDDLFSCSKWAQDSHLAVIALEVRQLVSELNEDVGSLPADFEKVAPVCKNAYSEADAILEFVGQHVGDDNIMPRDVYAYYDRATPVAHCSQQLAKTTYRAAYEHLLLAVLGINNLMVVADTNADMRLVHALPPSQPGSPIVIQVQNPYRQNPNQHRCTGTVLNFGSISSIDWNCN